LFFDENDVKKLKTSWEILFAISQIAFSKENAMSIWENPDIEQIEFIENKSFELAKKNLDYLFWGDAVIFRK